MQTLQMEHLRLSKPQASEWSCYSGRRWTHRPEESRLLPSSPTHKWNQGRAETNRAALKQNPNLWLLQSDMDRPVHPWRTYRLSWGKGSTELLLPEHNCSIFVRFNCRDSLIQASMSCRLRLSLVTDVEYTFTAIFYSMWEKRRDRIIGQ